MLNLRLYRPNEVRAFVDGYDACLKHMADILDVRGQILIEHLRDAQINVGATDAVRDPSVVPPLRP